MKTMMGQYRHSTASLSGRAERSSPGRRYFLRGTAALTALSAASSAVAQSSASASHQHTLLTPPTLHLSWLQRAADFFSRTISDLSAQSLQFSIQRAQPDECFERVADGSAHACFAYLRDWRTEPRARNFFAGIPGGMNTPGMLGWFYEGDGLSLWRSAGDAVGVVPMPVGSSGMGLAACSTSPLRGLDDIQGLKMRLLNEYAAQAWERAGGLAVALEESDVLEALRARAIAAAEPLSPLIKDVQPLAAVAPYCYYPSWQNPAATVVCMYNRQAYESLGEGLHTILAATARTTAEKMERELIAENADSMRQLQMRGAQLESLPEAVVTELLGHSQTLIADAVAADDWLRQVHDSYRDFQKKMLHLHRVTESAYFQSMMLPED